MVNPNRIYYRNRKAEVDPIKKTLQKIKHPPLLYIYQASLPEVDVIMQNNIHTKAGKKTLNKTDTLSEVKNEKRNQENEINNFSKWSNMEKVLYFINLPNDRKKSICRILTKESEVIGRILEFNKGKVEIASPMSGTNVTLLLDKIENIEIIGI